MPKVISYTPAWLSRPAPGFNVFSSASTKSHPNGTSSPSQHKNNDKYEEFQPGPRRTIVCRGLEVFVAVGNEIRWSDMGSLKADWEARNQSHSNSRRDHNNTATNDDSSDESE